MTNRFAETLRGLHPVTKTLSALLLIVAVVIVPSSGLVRLAWPALALALLWLGAGLPLRPLSHRLALAVPFIALAGTSALFIHPEGCLPLAGKGALTITDAGLQNYLSVLSKALVALIALSLLAQVTTESQLVAALRRIGLPRLLSTVVVLTLSYFSLLGEEAQRMSRARDARGVPPTIGRRARVAGAVVGSLFLRSFERAERVGHAMVARGFTGTLPAPRLAQLALMDWLLLALVALCAAALVIPC